MIGDTKPAFPKLSRLPSSGHDSQFHPFEAEDYPMDSDVSFLMERMFQKPEVDYYYFHEKGKRKPNAINAAIERGDFVVVEFQTYWYRRSKASHDRNYVRIEVPEYDWHREIVENNPMFIRDELKLGERKRIEIESWLKIQMEESFRHQAQKRKYEHDVFLSYAFAESTIAHEIHGKLSAIGVKAFLAEKNIEPGSDFAEEIRLVLRQN